MKLKLLFALLIVQLSFAQQRTCGMEQYMQRMMNDPIARQNYLDLQQRFEVELAKLQDIQNKAGNQNTTASPNVTIRIPVAVHFPDEFESNPCLITLAQSQINVLNADYNATNADISQWASASSNFPGVNVGSLDVQFILATQNHPAGTGLVNGDYAVTFGTDYLNGADNDTTWNGYMNLVCRDAGNGILGYSPLGGSPSAGATVVIAFDAFGSGVGCPGYVPGAPYNLGRTLTHELGHFFNLNHTFAGCSTSTNCATAGDRVCDTPPSNTSTFGCPTPGATIKCGVKTLTMNFMDYTNDACMYMFTAGQATRMLAYYNTISSQYSTTALGNSEFLEANFSIAPNPNKGTFSIRFKQVMEDYSVEIYDATGRILFEKKYIQNQDLQQNISLNSSLTGVYFVSIKSQGVNAIKKIIVE